MRRALHAEGNEWYELAASLGYAGIHWHETHRVKQRWMKLLIPSLLPTAAASLRQVKVTSSRLSNRDVGRVSFSLGVPGVVG